MDGECKHTHTHVHVYTAGRGNWREREKERERKRGERERERGVGEKEMEGEKEKNDQRKFMQEKNCLKNSDYYIVNWLTLWECGDRKWACAEDWG